MEHMNSLFARIEEGYVQGRPLHVENNQTLAMKKSVFRIIDEAEFLKMEQLDVQELLREQHIVVTGIRHRQRSFEEALLDIAPLDWVTSIQGEPVSLLKLTLTKGYISCLKTFPSQMALSGLA